MIGAIAVAVTSVARVRYVWRIPRERIPRLPWGSLAASGAAFIAGVADNYT